MAGKRAREGKGCAEVPPLPCRGASHFLSGFLLRRTSWNSLDEMRTIFSRTQGRDVGGCLVCCPLPFPLHHSGLHQMCQEGE